MNELPRPSLYRRLRPALFLLLLTAVFLWSLKRQNIPLTLLNNLTWKHGAAWGGLMGLTWLINSEKLRILLRIENIHLAGFESFKLSAASSVLNYLPLQGGTIVRAVYLQRCHGLSYFNFVTLLGTTYFIMLICDAFLVSGLSFFYIPPPHGLWMGFGVGLGLLLLILSIFLPLPKFLPMVIQRSKAGFLRALSFKRIVAMLFLLEIFSVITESLKFYILISALGLDTPPHWPVLWLISAFVFPSVILNLTPAGIGVREGALALIAWVSGIPVAHSIVYGGIDRLLTLGWVFAVGTPLAYRLFFSRLSPMQQNMVNQNQADHCLDHGNRSR